MASIQKRGKNSFLLVVEAGYGANNKRIKRTKTIHIKDDSLVKTKKRLNEFLIAELTKFKMEVEAKEYIAPNKITFVNFVKDEWLVKYASDPTNLSPATLETYKYHLKNHILPVFGHKRLDQIETIHIITFLDELKKPGSRKDGRNEALSTGSQELIYRTLKNVLTLAHEWNLIPKHPMTNIKKPEVKQKEMQFYDEKEANQVITALNDEPLMWRLLFLGSIIGGFRRGELIGLEWPLVNFYENTIRIEKNIPLTRNGKAIVKEPKTSASKATVDMPEWYMKELKEWQLQWLEEKEIVIDKWEGGENEYVFHGGYGKPLYYTHPSKKWRQFVQRHNLKYIRFQDLRHTCATLLMEENVPLKKIQKRLRHARYETTANIYTHVTKRGESETAAKFNKFDPSLRKFKGASLQDTT